MSTEKLDLERIVLDNGTEITGPPVITDNEGKMVDHEATETLFEQIKAWAEVAYGIVESGELGEDGELSSDDSKALRAAYADLPAVPGKSFVRSHAEESTRDALSDTSDPEAAFRVASMWSKISKDQKQAAPKAKTASAAKPAASPTELAVDKLATLRLATVWFETHAAELDENVDEIFVESAEDKVDALIEQMNEYVEWLDMEVEEGEEKPDFEGDLDPVVRDAAKIAKQKARRARTGGGGTYSGPRRSIGKHIEQAFEKVEVGTFLTVSEIVNLPSEEYGGDKPSSGAVANRLFPPSGSPCTLEDIEPGTNEDGKQGATKIA